MHISMYYSGKDPQGYLSHKKVNNQYSLRSLLNNSRIPRLESTYPNQLMILNSESGEHNIQVDSKVPTQGICP